MSNILVKEAVPGAGQAQGIMSKLRQIGIQDIQLFYDDGIQPYGMWAVCQVENRSSSLILPQSYMENNIKPYILWWCKNDEGRFRVPNDQDLHDIVTIVKRAPEIWDKGGETRSDKFDAQDQAKDEAHRTKQKQMVKDIAPAMKKAIRKGNI